ncbi:sensor histidine kinase [Nannocystis pusilla]|uniref:sensor histidine kinase n=1 Tax=Nannocystis pusilla TaxID=889268 RepID=UPI003BF2F590
MLTNLLANAVQHGAMGPVRLEICGRDLDLVRITVWNEGVIPEHVLPVVFDRFQRGDIDSARESRGLGLGLYITRQIVLAHGGTIEANSSVDKGTSFTVRLPRSAGTDRSPRAD